MDTKNIGREKVRKDKILGNLKNLGILGLIAIGIVLMLSGSVNAYVIQGGGVCSCNSCDDCENALNNNTNCSKEVRLTMNITNYAGTCINNPANFNNKTFDCQGHTIDGDNSVLYGVCELGPCLNYIYGIYLEGKSGNTIKNCTITNFGWGIYLSSSSHNTLTNNKVNNNWIEFSPAAEAVVFIGYGIVLVSSSNNTISHNIANNNGHCENLTFVFGCSGVGISLSSSSNNTVINNTAKDNKYYGIHLSSSSNNTLIYNTAKDNNQSGIYLYSSSNNTITNNTANDNGVGIYVFNNSNFNKILNNKISNNNETGITISDYPQGYWDLWCKGNSNNTIEGNMILTYIPHF